MNNLNQIKTSKSSTLSDLHHKTHKDSQSTTINQVVKRKEILKDKRLLKNLKKERVLLTQLAAIALFMD